MTVRVRFSKVFKCPGEGERKMGHTKHRLPKGSEGKKSQRTHGRMGKDRGQLKRSLVEDVRAEEKKKLYKKKLGRGSIKPPEGGFQIWGGEP